MKESFNVNIVKPNVHILPCYCEHEHCRAWPLCQVTRHEYINIKVYNVNVVKECNRPEQWILKLEACVSVRAFVSWKLVM
jgi:hypothetical protein